MSRRLVDRDGYDAQDRLHCDKGHLVCQECRMCACEIDYRTASRRIRVRTDSQGMTACRECRYLAEFAY